MKFYRILSMLISCLIIVAFQHAVGYCSQSNTWEDTNIPQHRCIHHAEEIARYAGYEDITVTGNSVMYDRGKYQFGIRCIADRGLVFFYCVGPSSDKCSEINDYMKSYGRWNRPHW